MKPSYSGRRWFMVSIAFALFFLAYPLAATAQIQSDDVAVGNWIGWAEPEFRFQAPFDQVRFQVTFFADGTAYWNDGHELRFGHGTGHGSWVRTEGDGVLATFVWIAYDSTTASGAGNIFKLRFTGEIGEGNPDEITAAQLNLTIFPPGTDPLDPEDTGGIPVFGSFDVANARRVKLDPPQDGDVAGDPAGEYVLGAWFGKAVPEDPSTAPFPEVVMMLNFLPDRNIVATDVFELDTPHVTAHGGPWIRTEDGTVHCTFLWTNLTDKSDYNGYAKVRITGQIDPDNLDFMTGTVRPTGFATGADVLDPDDPFSGFLGLFNIVELTRIKADPSVPTQVGQDYSDNPSSGAWFGRAVADDPENAPFPEIVIMPHFLPSGSLVWNDSREHDAPHGTGFGNWIPAGDGGNGVKAVGVLQKFDVSVPNSFGGAFKLKFNGQVDPADPNNMTGSLELVDFGADDIPLPSADPDRVFHRDPDDTGGESFGTYTIVELRRIEAQPAPSTPPPPLPESNPIVGHSYLHETAAVGNWIGWAEPEFRFQAPFDQVRFQVTFFADGTAYWNDGHELRFGHGTGHGSWVRTEGDGVLATFVWIAYDSTTASGAGNIFKLRFTGEIGEGNPDEITAAQLNLTIFPPGTDPLDPEDTGGIPVFGSFDVANARRVKLDPPQDGDVAGDPAGEYVLGAWFGKAVPEDPSTAPFPEVVMMLNFLPDRNIVATDVFELDTPHVTAHGGPWIRTEDGTVHCTFLWTNLTDKSDYNGYAKVRITGQIDPDNLDFMTGTVRPTGFATGADVLDPDDPFSGFLGLFNIVELTRIKADPSVPTQVGQDYSDNPSSGAWFGRAVADDPENAPFPEIVIMPHFLPSGSLVWNDSREHDAPHGTGFGNWIPAGDGGNGVKAVGVLQKFDVSVPNSFGGAFKLKFNGQVDPADPNNMTGSLELVDFGADDIPLPSADPDRVFHRDPDDTGGESFGTYTIVELRRITQEAGGTAVEEVASSTQPNAFTLSNAYPNPFNPSTTIHFGLPLASKVTLKIYNTAGQSIRELVNQDLAPGKYQAVWDGTDDSGAQVTSGVYFYRIEALGITMSQKVTLIK